MSEWLGWIATGVFTSSYLFKRANALRLVQMIAALMWIGYGVLVNAHPGDRRQPAGPRSRGRGDVVGAQLSRRRRIAPPLPATRFASSARLSMLIVPVSVDRQPRSAWRA